MTETRNWTRALGPLGGAVMLLLVLQYFLGLWTSVYAPAQFASFDAATNYPPALRIHILVGDLLFALSVLGLVFAALSRRLSLVVPGVVLVAAILGAGEFGMAFVNSTPNDPVDSFAMGALFLVALLAGAALLMFAARARRESRPALHPTPTTS